MQHLVLLRRMILSRSDASMAFSDGAGRDFLAFSPDGFIGSSDAVAEKLRRVYQAREARVFQVTEPGRNMAKTPTARAIVSSLRGYQPDQDSRQRLVDFFQRFPPVAVKLAPLHRIDFEDFTSYIHLHHQSLETGHAELRRYLAEVEGRLDDQHLKRLRVCLAVFLLGLIAPVKQARESSARGQDKRSILNRIIQRVRGL